ncbi:MAG: hypothetical protein EOP04_02690 [Proteobacteria bacterium]|nr:MAG: hypothetical protein EOP04_02690 [Pseudomonadota bacterium]
MQISRLKHLLSRSSKPKPEGYSSAHQYVSENAREWSEGYPSQLYQLVIRQEVTILIALISIQNFIKFYSSSGSSLIAIVQFDLMFNYLLAKYLFESGRRKLFLLSMQALPFTIAAGWLTENYLLYHKGLQSHPSELQLGTIIAIIWLVSFSKKALSSYACALIATIGCFAGLYLTNNSFFQVGHIERYVEPTAVGIFLNFLLSRLAEYRFYSTRQNQAQRGIFQASKSALFTIGKTQNNLLYIDIERSPSMDTLLGIAPVGRPDLSDYWLSKWEASDTDKSRLTDIITIILGGGAFDYELNAGSLPYNMVCMIDDKRRYISLVWSPMFSVDGERVESLAICATDITNQRQAETDRDNAQLRTSAVLELIAAAKRSSAKFITSSYNELSVIVEHPASHITAEYLDDLLATIHGIKGDSRTLRLSRIAESAHSVETKLLSYKSVHSQGIDPKNIGAVIEELIESISGYKKILETDLSWIMNSDGKLQVSQEFIQGIFLANKKQSVEISKLIHWLSEENPLHEETHSLLNTVLPQVEHLLKDCISHFEPTAKRLMKPLPDLKVVKGSLRFSPRANAVITQSMTQLMSNSLDHGIELPEDRRLQGKSPKGTVEINVIKIDNGVELWWSDDGRGLNLEKIKSKAESLGIKVDDADDQDLAKMILLPSFSTKDSLSDISGRGLGMHTIAKLMDSLGGEFKIGLIEKKHGGYHKFASILTIPDHEVFIDYDDEYSRSTQVRVA